METVQANIKVANKGQFEQVTVRKFHPNTSWTCNALKLALWFLLPRAARISHKPESIFFDIQMIIYIYP